MQCWLQVTVLHGKISATTRYIIDTVKIKEVAFQTSLGEICKDAANLKVFESSQALEKMLTKFKCQVRNTLLAKKSQETLNCHSTVLIE